MILNHWFATAEWREGCASAATYTETVSIYCNIVLDLNLVYFGIEMIKDEGENVFHFKNASKRR